MSAVTRVFSNDRTLDEKEVALSLGSSLPSYLLPGAPERRALVSPDALNMSLTDDRIMTPATAYSSTLTSPAATYTGASQPSTLSPTSSTSPLPYPATAAHRLQVPPVPSAVQSPLAAPNAVGNRGPPVSLVTPLPGSLSGNLVDDRRGYYV